MLQKVSISENCCSLECSIYKRILKLNVYFYKKNIKQISTLIIIRTIIIYEVPKTIEHQMRLLECFKYLCVCVFVCVWLLLKV